MSTISNREQLISISSVHTSNSIYPTIKVTIWATTMRFILVSSSQAINLDRKRTKDYFLITWRGKKASEVKKKCVAINYKLGTHQDHYLFTHKSKKNAGLIKTYKNILQNK